MPDGECGHCGSVETRSKPMKMSDKNSTIAIIEWCLDCGAFRKNSGKVESGWYPGFQA